MTLTQAAVITRRGIVIFLLTSILLVGGKIGYTIYQQQQLAKLPIPEEKAENKFGQLPKLNFPPSSVSSSNYSYSVDTSTGDLPSFTTLVPVYFIPQGSVSLLAPEKSRELAGKFGFVSDPLPLSESEYRFTNEMGGEFKINIASGNFTLNLASDSASPSARPSDQPLETEQIISDFKNFLAARNLLPEELKDGPSKMIGNTISLWPDKIDDKVVVTPLVNQGLIRAVYDSKSEEDKFPRIFYTYWNVDKTTSSTYKIKSSEDALSALQQGQGYIVLTPTLAKVSIANIYLAYYQSEEYTPYLQPVYVFEGPGFMALVEALEQL